MTNRGKHLLNLALDRFNDNDAFDSPADDSDRDPDYEPEKNKTKYVPQYFKDNDIFFSREKPKYDGPESILKRIRLIDYTDETEVFPSPQIGEFQGLTESEAKSATENSNLILVPLQIETINASEDKIYHQLQSVDYNEPSGQDSLNKISTNVSASIPDESNTDGIIMSALPTTPDNQITDEDVIDFIEPESSSLVEDQVPHDKIETSERANGKGIKKADLKNQRKTAKLPIAEKHKLLAPCEKTCRKKCFEALSSDQRSKIFNYFKELDFGKRQLILDKYIQKQGVKYRKVDAEFNKNYSIVYNLPIISNPPLITEESHDSIESASTCTEQNETLTVPNETAVKPDGNPTELGLPSSELNGNRYANMIAVCKTMFLHTIGYKSDGIITNFLKRTVNDLPCLEDKRGKANTIKMKQIGEHNYNAVKEHIESFHPQVSHYNIEHAPNRRYLPCDITVHQMHKDFISKNKHISYETYRKIFDNENIGFSSPTQDDCSVCSVFKQHIHAEEPKLPEIPFGNSKQMLETSKDAETEQPIISSNSQPQSCSICDQYEIHKRRYTVARQKYNDDAEREWDDTHELYTVDMQKVLILPKMTIKNSFFVSRLVVFHETFANLKSAGQNKCVLWHEAIRGRNGPDVVSAYYNALIRLDDETKHVTFWADNCTAQNKNWVLFTACIIFVNEDWGPETITFKFFEPGHSFMKADSIHGQIGKKWKKTPEVLDYEDLEKLINSSNKFNNIISLRAEDFKLFENGCIQRKKESPIPKLGDIKSVQFRKGSRKMFFKQELENDEFSEATVLKPKFKLELPKSVNTDRGINSKKKEVIIKELLPHMPPRKQIFWTNLPSADNLEDLGKSIAQ